MNKMKVIHGIKNLKHKFRNPAVTIGVFDGVHRGHKKILSVLAKRAKQLKGDSIVITFDPHPVKILQHKNKLPLLISLQHRIRLIAESGIDALILINFTKKLSKMSPDDFVRKILVKKIGAREILAGEDFAFGRGKVGGHSLLKALSRKHGFKVIKIPILKSSGALISSSAIRKLVRMGRIKEASRLLARPVSVLGTVKKGAKRARFLGFPTANIDPHHEVIPPSGVYTVLIKYKKKTYGGVLNIGKRPTFYKKSEPTIEVHIFNFNRDIYGDDLEIEFVKKIRDEKKFPDRIKLIEQIRLDEAKSRKILS